MLLNERYKRFCVAISSMLLLMHPRQSTQLRRRSLVFKMVKIRALLSFATLLACVAAHPVSLPEKATAQGQQELVSYARNVRLHARRIEGSPLRRISSIDEVLTDLGMTRDDPGALAIAAFSRRRQPAIVSRGVDMHQRRIVSDAYRHYMALVPIRGDEVDRDNPERLALEMLYSQGRSRFSHITGVIELMLQHRAALLLHGERLAFLEALLLRFRQTRDVMTPTIDEILGTSTEDVQRERLDRWLAGDFSNVPLFLQRRVQARVQPLISSPERFIQDLIMVNGLERDLDDFVERLELETAAAGQRLPHTHLKKRDEPPRPRVSRPGGPAEALDVQVPHRHEFRIQPRSTDSTDTNKGIWRDRTIQEALDELGMEEWEAGSRPIGNFWRLKQPLFLPMTRTRESLKPLAAIYSPYQRTYRVRGSAFSHSIQNADTLRYELNDGTARDRFRRMVRILQHTVDNAEALRLDRVRVEYLQALIRRFEVAADLLTRMPKEIAHRAPLWAAERFNEPGGSSDPLTRLYEVLAKTVLETQQFLTVRLKIAKVNFDRFALDLWFLNRLEIEFDRLVPGAGTRMATGIRWISRDVSESSLSIVKRDPTEADMQSTLDGVGMSLQDPSARPIAIWRLSQESLLDQRTIPQHVGRALRFTWESHRRRYVPASIAAHAVSDEARLSPYLNADEGRRFMNVRMIIR